MGDRTTFSFFAAVFRLKLFMTQLSGRRLTCIYADKGAFGHVVQAANSPSFVLGFEELETHLQAVLHQSVGAHLRAALTPLVALVDPERRQDTDYSLREKENDHLFSEVIMLL